MKSREVVLALFRDKYAYLQAVCQQQLEPFNEAAIYQNPDGGWQLNLEQPGTDYKAAITLRPGDDDPHEMHGVIGARWFQEGGAFDVNGIPGWLGYPIADDETDTVSVNLPSLRGPHDSVQETQLWKSSIIAVAKASSQFEFGRIDFREGLTWNRAAENLDVNALRGYLSDYDGNYYIGDIFGVPVPRPPISLQEGQPVEGADLFALFSYCPLLYGPQDPVYVVLPEMSVALSETGKLHVPKDIENAAETILDIEGIHVVGARSWSCDLYHHLHVGVNWVFHAKVEGFDRFSIFIRRDGTDNHATINARSKPSLFGGKKTIERQFTIPNRFRVI